MPDSCQQEGCGCRWRSGCHHRPGGRKPCHTHSAKSSCTTGCVPICLSWRAAILFCHCEPFVRSNLALSHSWRLLRPRAGLAMTGWRLGEPVWLQPNHHLLDDRQPLANLTPLPRARPVLALLLLDLRKGYCPQETVLARSPGEGAGEMRFCPFDPPLTPSGTRCSPPSSASPGFPPRY